MGNPRIAGMFSRSATVPSRKPWIWRDNVGEFGQNRRNRRFKYSIFGQIRTMRWPRQTRTSRTTVVVLETVAAPKELPQPGKFKRVKKVVGTVAKLAPVGTIVGCHMSYLNDDGRDYREEESKHLCARIVWEFTEYAPLSDSLDERLGQDVDAILMASRRAAHIQLGGHTVFDVPLGGGSVTVYGPSDFSTKTSGKDYVFDTSAELAPPGRLLLPIRAFEFGGRFKIDWTTREDGGTETVTLTRARDGLAVAFEIGSAEARTRDGTSVKLDAPPYISTSGRAMIPS